MSAEDNGNLPSSGGGGGVLIKPNSSSNEDLSEYTDADESISAPTEFLAEFLSAVMLKDYPTALKYCKLILQYEPNNATAKEFYPLILEKIRIEANDNESEEEEASEESSGTGSDNSTSSTSSEESSEGQEEDEEDEVEVEQSAGDKRSKGSSDGTTGSYSSLEDDEAVDQLVALARKYQIDNVNLGNGNKIYNTSTSALLQNKAYSKIVPSPPETNSNVQAGTNFPFGTSSDSESPTEPVSQQTIKILRARVVPGTKYPDMRLYIGAYHIKF
ncbi:unnamed protein product [Acanthoscelides obtectus]|uniref:Uncharacterized protein n=1 Tax=Acanthoscelides obtectus TaxID=200917 RepID=A0A9P0Q505_ACAOB|nr:unnamed protein product [Acanthoscelides obtectus]CAK1676287.1 Glutamate-rich protein 2 [Acanthoscelides obtectus]